MATVFSRLLLDNAQFFSIALLHSDILVCINHIPGITVELAYTTPNNFTGQVVPGYYANIAHLTNRAAQRLKEVAKDLHTKNLGLLIYDANRPVKSVNYFYTNWQKSPENIKRKQVYYPSLTKEDLFRKGYIAPPNKGSAHSRGSTVDLTLVDLNTQKTLDMGTVFDFLGPQSATHNEGEDISRQAVNHRKILAKAMEKYGFINYSEEWWYYTLKDEPFGKLAFDFNIHHRSDLHKYHFCS